MSAGPIPKLDAQPGDWKDDGRTPDGVRRFSNLGNWLKYPDKSVTRSELWELLNRYEAGRVALESHNFQRYADEVLAHWKAQAWWRRLWRLVWRIPAPVKPRLPSTPLTEF